MKKQKLLQLQGRYPELSPFETGSTKLPRKKMSTCDHLTEVEYRISLKKHRRSAFVRYHSRTQQFSLMGSQSRLILSTDRLASPCALQVFYRPQPHAGLLRMDLLGFPLKVSFWRKQARRDL